MKSLLKQVGGLVFVLLLCLACASAFKAGFRRASAAIERSDRETYAAWITYSGRKDITYEQWLMLRNSDLITIRN